MWGQQYFIKMFILLCAVILFTHCQAFMSNKNVYKMVFLLRECSSFQLFSSFYL